MNISLTEVLMYAMVYIAELLITYSYFTDKYVTRMKTPAILLVSSACYFIMVLFNFTFENNMIISITLFILSSVLICFICFRAKILQAILEAILLTTIVFGTESVTIFLISSLFGIGPDSYQSYFPLFTIVEVISKTLFLLIAKMLSSFSTSAKDAKFNSRYVPLFLYPITIDALLLTIFITSIEYHFSNELFSIIAVIGGLSLFISIGIFIYYQHSIEQEKELEELHAELEKEEIDRKYLKIIEQQNKELHILVHDTKNHLLAINSLANSADVTNYINTFYKDIEKYSYSTRTKNKILDLILNKYYSLANANDITFSTDVRVSNLSHCINDADFSIILNNLLDNAMEAAEKSLNKKVEFSIKKNDDFYIISVINSSKPPKSQSNGLISTKMDSSRHGYGTKSVKKYVRKNGGEFDWYFDDEKQEFHSTVVFENKNRN